MTKPRYQNLKSEDMPVRQEEGAIIKVFSGSSGGVKAPTLNYIPITMDSSMFLRVRGHLVTITSMPPKARFYG